MKKKDNKKKKLIELKENYLDKIRIKLFSFPSSSIKDEKNQEEIIVVNNNQVNKDDKNKNAYFCWIRKVKVPKNNYEKIKIEVKFKVGNEFLIVDLNTDSWCLPAKEVFKCYEKIIYDLFQGKAIILPPKSPPSGPRSII